MNYDEHEQIWERHTMIRFTMTAQNLHFWMRGERAVFEWLDSAFMFDKFDHVAVRQLCDWWPVHPHGV